jgi:hypothetical protein
MVPNTGDAASYNGIRTWRCPECFGEHRARIAHDKALDTSQTCDPANLVRVVEAHEAERISSANNQLTTMKTKNLGNAAFATPYETRTACEQALAAYFPTSENLISEVTDPEEARKLKASKGSTTWGAGPIGETGYFQLARPSAQSKRDKRLVIVCKAELLETPALTTAETLRRSAIMERITAGVRKGNTREPDSLGDRMFRCRLAYVNAQAGIGSETPVEVVARAEALLLEAGIA